MGSNYHKTGTGQSGQGFDEGMPGHDWWVTPEMTDDEIESVRQEIEKAYKRAQWVEEINASIRKARVEFLGKLTSSTLRDLLQLGQRAPVDRWEQLSLAIKEFLLLDITEQKQVLHIVRTLDATLSQVIASEQGTQR